ncbi:DUF7511 domain-containing protein [Halovivax limisalsi]|uniref:DUF7511 domain-containing protein n=1 Tax=Halovivax limisalsi TaxID=1453760 RepID=UPI001FFD6B57|nr:hypothetical protein [Halovivax limisalsi]
MTATDPPTGERTPEQPAAEPALSSPTELASTVVRNDAAPDRRTVHPRHCHEWARLTAWLSADDEVFLPLDECR